MKILNNILSVFIAAMVFVAANGIFFENYFCSICSEEHEEISLFEFGEKQHSHAHVCNCLTVEDHCCQNENSIEHQKNTEVKFFSISLLYAEFYKIAVEPVSADFLHHFNIITHSICALCTHCIGEIIKIFPVHIVIDIFATNNLFSILRL